jgi:hypothetical protein
MLNEHAITYSDKIVMKDLEYLVKKANRLGRLGRETVRVYQQEDSDGFHVYFEVTGKPPEKKEDD